jgi:hypothetical protein
MMKDAVMIEVVVDVESPCQETRRDEVKSQRLHDNAKILVPTDGARRSETVTRAINILEQILI